MWLFKSPCPWLCPSPYPSNHLQQGWDPCIKVYLLSFTYFILLVDGQWGDCGDVNLRHAVEGNSSLRGCGQKGTEDKSWRKVRILQGREVYNFWSELRGLLFGERQLWIGWDESRGGKGLVKSHVCHSAISSLVAAWSCAQLGSICPLTGSSQLWSWNLDNQDCFFLRKCISFGWVSHIRLP